MNPCECTVTTLCTPCAGRFLEDLSNVHALARELATTASRQDATAPRNQGGGGRAYDAPLPYNTAAAAALRNLEAVVRTLHAVVSAVQYRHPLTLAGCVTRLVYLFDFVRTHPDAVDWAVEVRAAVVAARRAIDLPPDRVYAGPCGKEREDGAVCTMELYARVGATTLKCRECGTVWDVQVRRDDALASISDLVLPAEQITRALSAHGLNITRHRLAYWASTGRLEKRPGGYRVGDVLDVAEAMRRRREESRRTLAAQRASES